MNLLKFFILPVAIVALTQGCVSMDKREADPEKAARIYSDLGLQYLRQGDLELALVKLERSLELDEDNADAHHYMAETFNQMGNKKQAEQYFKKALRLDDENPMLLNNYGAFLCGQGSFQASEEYFLRAADLPSYRTPERAYENLALCAMQTDNVTKAEEYFRKALEIRPGLPQSLYQMALISYQQEKYLSARAFIERFHAIGKTRQSLNLAIRIEEALDNTAAADEYREQLSSQFSESGQD